jgi:hypothetical protein
MLAATIITACATMLLAAVAYLQMRAGRWQAYEQAEAVKRGMQPRVTAERWFDPEHRQTYDEVFVSMQFFLTNDGAGPAFNVAYGVDSDDQSHPGDNGHLYRTMRVAEILPGPSDSLDSPGSEQPIVVKFRHENKPRDEIDQGLVYWTRFDNVMGERFEVRNPHDGKLGTEVRKLKDP